jgi:mRNA interferase MazF
MARGDVVVIGDRAGGDYAGKPRPAVIVQSEHFESLKSVLICPITSIEVPANLLRLPLQVSESLPLGKTSWVEIEKMSAVRRTRIGSRIGRLSDADLAMLTQRLVVLIGAA